MKIFHYFNLPAISNNIVDGSSCVTVAILVSLNLEL